MCETRAERIGNKLKELMDEKGYTQKKMANAVNVAPPTMSDYLKGKTNMPVTVFADICDELEIDPGKVLSVEETGGMYSEEVSVSKAIDALSTVLKVFSPAISFVPVNVNKTEFVEYAEPYGEPEFEDKENCYYSILIKNEDIQRLIIQWQKAIGILSTEILDEEEKDTIFSMIYYKNALNLKQEVDTIDWLTGALFKSGNKPILVSETRESVPMKLDDFNLLSVLYQLDGIRDDEENGHYPRVRTQLINAIKKTGLFFEDKDLNELIDKALYLRAPSILLDFYNENIDFYNKNMKEDD